jgi:hypothetical protein
LWLRFERALVCLDAFHFSDFGDHHVFDCDHPRDCRSRDGFALCFERIFGPSTDFGIFPCLTAELADVLDEGPPDAESRTKAMTVVPDVIHPWDPSQIIKQQAWTNFIEGNCNILRKIHRHRQFGYLLPVLIVLGLEIAIVILDIQRDSRVREVDEIVHDAMLRPISQSAALLSYLGISPPPDTIVIDLVPKAIAILELVSRLVFQIYALPFLILSNFSILFWNWSNLRANFTRIFWVKIVGLVFFVICAGALIAGLVLKHTLVFFQLPKDFGYSRPTFERITESAQAPICDLRIANMSIVQIAGLPVIAHTLNDSGPEGETGLYTLSFDAESRDPLRNLYNYLFAEDFPPTPVPPPLDDFSRIPMCSSNRTACIFLYGKKNCSDEPTFAAVYERWCQPIIGLCDMISSLSANDRGYCDLAVRDGIPLRGVCDPTPSGFWDWACPSDGACSHWADLCPTFFLACSSELYNALCTPTGLCATMNFTEKCSPMDRVLYIDKYRFQLELQYIAFGMNQFFMMAMGGFTNPQHIAIAVENVGLVWFHWIIETIVPFYRGVYRGWLSPLMGGLGQTMVQLVFGPNRMPLRFGQEVQGLEYMGAVAALVHEYFLGFATIPLLAGHSHTALISRALALLKKSYAVTFEGSQYHLSPLEGFFGAHDPDSEYFIVNEASGSSVFAMDDTLAKWNYRLPDWQQWWKPATPYDTFCLLAAGCVYDNRYDAICNASVGFDRYSQFFESWNRSRSK